MHEMPEKIWAHIQLHENDEYGQFPDYQWREFACFVDKTFYHNYAQYARIDTIQSERAEMQAAITELREGAAALLLMGDQEPLKQALENTKKWSE